MTATFDKLRDDVLAMAAEIEAMRPVVEAAIEYTDMVRMRHHVPVSATQKIKIEATLLAQTMIYQADLE